MTTLDPDYEYHEFYLDSSDATTPYDSSVSQLNWPMFNLNTALKNVASFKVLEAQIPISYCVTAGGSFNIIMYNADKSATKTVTITLPTTGSPSGTQIAESISQQLAYTTNVPSSLSGWKDNNHPQTYLVCTFISSASSATGLPYFSFNTNDHSYGSVLESNQDFEIVVPNQRTEDVMGISLGTNQCINWGVVGAGAGTRKLFNSMRPTLITGSPYIFVSSNAIGNLCKTFLPAGAALLGGGVSSPQIAKVPVSTAVQGQWLIYADVNQNWFDVDNIATISQMDFYCQLGNYGGYIDFQGLPFSLKLGVLMKRDNKVATNTRNTMVRTF